MVLENTNIRYVPEFYTKIRDKKLSIWVIMPNGESYNIWDQKNKKKLSKQEQDSIITAFCRGLEAAKMLIAPHVSNLDSASYSPHSVMWIEEEKP